jgi:hypothetical protein
LILSPACTESRPPRQSSCRATSSKEAVELLAKKKLDKKERDRLQKLVKLALGPTSELPACAPEPSRPVPKLPPRPGRPKPWENDLPPPF